MIWGDAMYGGDSIAVLEQLKNVQQIQASSGAFADILGEGCLVSWGDAHWGGDSSGVKDQLKTVQQIQACRKALAAVLAFDRGSVRGLDVLHQRFCRRW